MFSRLNVTTTLALLGVAHVAVADSVTTSGFVVHDSPPSNTEAVYEQIHDNFGFVPNLAKVMAGSPALLNGYFNLQNQLRDHGKLSQAEINIVQMSIAVENQCSYCTAGHTMAGRVFFKTSEEDMRAVCMRQPLSDPKHRALQRFALEIYNGHGQVSDATMQAFLSAGYTRDQALDVVACISAKVMSNFTNAIAKTELDPPLQEIAAGLKMGAH